MKINFEDREWDFEIDDIDLNEARIIFRQTGLTLLKLQEGMDEVHPEAFAALYWLMKKQNGIAVDWNKMNFHVVKFGQAIGDAALEEREAEEARAATNPTTEGPVQVEPETT